MTDRQKDHDIELRIHTLETRFSHWRNFVIGAALFLGLGSAYGIWELYNRTLDTAEIEVIKAAKDRIKTIRNEAEVDAAAIKDALRTACHDPESVKKFGRCIFHLNPGRYGLDYGAATALCAAYGAKLCTMPEMQAAQENGAQWCSWGWVQELTNGGGGNFDMRGSMAFPMQITHEDCGGRAGLITRSNIHVLNGNAGANCCM